MYKSVNHDNNYYAMRQNYRINLLLTRKIFGYFKFFIILTA
jgi:hypothetical protein